jgi:myosin heavy subunit
MPGERNFHVFYQLCAGLRGAGGDELASTLQLGDAASYAILNKGIAAVQLSPRDPGAMGGSDDARDFSDVLSSLSALGFVEEELDGVWALLVGFLALGEIRC